MLEVIRVVWISYEINGLEIVDSDSHGSLGRNALCNILPSMSRNLGIDTKQRFLLSKPCQGKAAN